MCRFHWGREEKRAEAFPAQRRKFDRRRWNSSTFPHSRRHCSTTFLQYLPRKIKACLSVCFSGRASREDLRLVCCCSGMSTYSTPTRSSVSTARHLI